MVRYYVFGSLGNPLSKEQDAAVQANRIQIVMASIAILGSAVLAAVLTPHELMARTSVAPRLESVIPTKFGTWTLVPDNNLVTPAEPDGYVPDEKATKIYSQEVGRTYTDGRGNIIMLLVAYAPVQNYRLKSHRPEICYTAGGFRISDKHSETVAYRDGVSALDTVRLVAQREARLEPITYWMTVGHEISNSVVTHQLNRLKYGLRGKIPDGALFRVSTVGLPPEASFKLQDQFIRDLFATITPQELKFFTGTS